MKFTKPWRTLLDGEAAGKKLPVLDVFLRTSEGKFFREIFIVDSGADISMGPRRLGELVGVDWENGQKIEIRGIAQRKECIVPATVHQLEIHVREAGCRMIIPFCLAEGDAPLLLGRDGFFDAFRIGFDKSQLVTEFELLENN